MCVSQRRYVCACERGMCVRVSEEEVVGRWVGRWAVGRSVGGSSPKSKNPTQ